MKYVVLCLFLTGCMVAMQEGDRVSAIRASTYCVPGRSEEWDSVKYDAVFKNPEKNSCFSCLPLDVRKLIEEYIYQEESQCIVKSNQWLQRHEIEMEKGDRGPIQNIFFNVVCSQIMNPLLGPLIKRLALSGADVNQFDYYEDTVFDKKKKGISLSEFSPLQYASSSPERFALAQALMRCSQVRINDKDDYGKTALRHAFISCSGKTLAALLQAGADPTMQDIYNENLFDGRLTIAHDGLYNIVFTAGSHIKDHADLIPTVYALYDIYYKDQYDEICNLLRLNQKALNLGSKVDDIDVTHQSFVSWAARHGKGDFVIDYIVHGVPSSLIPCPLTRNSLLMDAVIGGDISLVEYLLKLGRKDAMDVNYQNDLGQTALMLAAQKKDSEEILALLCEYGANLEKKDYSQQTALLYAIMARNTHGAIFLLDSGANPNVHARKGTACIYAARKEDLAVMKKLVEKGASITGFPPGGDVSFLHWISGVNCRCPEIFKFILKKGLDSDGKYPEINTQMTTDSFGRTPLCHIVEYGTPELVDIFVQHGALIDAPDRVHENKDALYGGGTGQTPLFYAAFNGNKVMVEKLLGYGACVNYQSQLNGNTPLHELIYGYSTAKKLIGNSANPDQHARIFNLYSDTLNLLVSYGADPRIANKPQNGAPGYSAYDMVSSQDHVKNLNLYELNAFKAIFNSNGLC